MGSQEPKGAPHGGGKVWPSSQGPSTTSARNWQPGGTGAAPVLGIGHLAGAGPGCELMGGPGLARSKARQSCEKLEAGLAAALLGQGLMVPGG